MRNFRFILRYCYEEILGKIIKIAQTNLVKLLKAIPELLPF